MKTTHRNQKCNTKRMKKEDREKKIRNKYDVVMVCQTKTMVVHIAINSAIANGMFFCIVTNSKDKNASACELQTHLAKVKKKKNKNLRNETAPNTLATKGISFQRCLSMCNTIDALLLLLLFFLSLELLLWF